MTLALENVSVSLGGRMVLQNIDFAAAPGEFVAICGPNGAGKSVFLRALAGLLPGGRPEPRLTAYAEQGARCAWGFSVTDLVALGRIPHGDTKPVAVARALAACGISGLAERRIDQISGGQARRAMLARALATEPQNLLLDEPVNDLDPSAAHAMMALLADFSANGGTVVCVLHAVELALRHATRMVVISGGRIVADGTPLATLPEAARCFDMKVGADPLPRLLPHDVLES